jgi:glycosyltransferase 2 family protein
MRDVDPRDSNDPRRRPTLKRIIWPVALSVSVLGVVAALTFDVSDYAEAVGGLNPWLFALALGAVALRILFGGWRFNYISRGRLSLAAGIRGQLAWDFFSNVTPSAIGGGPFAIVYLTRDSAVRGGDATAWTIFCIVLDQLWYVLLVPLVLVASLHFNVIPQALGPVGYGVFITYLGGLMLWIAVFAYATIVRPSLFQKIADVVLRLKALRRFRGRVNREMTQLERRARILRSQPLKFYLNGFLLTLGSWSTRYLLIMFVVWGMYAPVDKFLVFVRGAALTLLSMAMPTPGGSGGVEALYVILIGPLMPSAAVAPTLLAWRFLGYYVFIGIGIFLTTHYLGRNLRSAPRARTPDDARVSKRG